MANFRDLCVVILGGLLAPCYVQAVTPLQKVTELLAELEAKIVRDGAEEKKIFDEYVAWCNGGGKDKEYEIETAKTKIEGLSATIEKAASDFTAASENIEDLAGTISGNEQDLKSATVIREKEQEDNSAVDQELVESIDTLERAINVLQRKLHGSSLLQRKVNKKNIEELIHTLSTVIDAAALSSHDRKALLGLVQSSDADADGDEDLGAPAPEAYSSHSEGIIDVLEDLKQKAETQLVEARRDEMTSKHNFELLKQSLESQLKVDTKQLNDNKAVKAEATEIKAKAEGDLENTKHVLEDAQTVLKNMESDCATKKEDHEASTKSRAEELKAVQGAQQALQEATGGAEAAVYSKGAPAFLQIIHDGGKSWLQTRTDLANFEVVNLVRKLAREHGSAALTQLAGRISAAMQAGAKSGEDPFVKVRKMIADMIEKLVAQAGAEAEHKQYCDREMADTKTAMDEKKYDIEKISSILDKQQADSAKLKEEVAQLTADIAKTVKSQGEIDKIRQAEKKLYQETKADVEMGLKGVRMALGILRDYFATDGAALVQQPAAPGVHSAASGTANAIMEFLKVIESDFGKHVAEMDISEETAAVAYEKQSQENRVSQAIMDKDVEYKTREETSLAKSITELQSDLSGVKSQLQAIEENSKVLRGMCEDKPETYEVRQARRQAEVDGLKEALKILEGETAFLQRQKHRRSGLRGTALSP